VQLLIKLQQQQAQQQQSMATLSKCQKMTKGIPASPGCYGRHNNSLLDSNALSNLGEALIY